MIGLSKCALNLKLLEKELTKKNIKINTNKFIWSENKDGNIEIYQAMKEQI